MGEPSLKLDTFRIRHLVESYRSGRVVIPEFQRDYVWKKSRAPKLFDSLYRRFPVSSLLLWQNAENTRARRRDPRPTRSATIDWLIDGQQRVITLARAMAGDEGIDVVFHPEYEQFQLVSAATKRDGNWFRIADLLDDQAFREIRRNLNANSSDRREANFEKVRQIRDYEVPFVRMVDHSFESAVNAFTRINTLGVRLKKEDIESAQVAAKHSGFIADEVAPFLESLKRQGFTRLNVMHLFRACAFVAQPDGRNRTPLHELGQAEVLAAWRRTQKATERALSLIRGELGLINMNILWSGALLVPIIAVCATSTPKSRDAKGLCAWLALAALLHRYSRSSDSALDQDLRACREADPVGALLKNLRQHRPSLTASPEDFSGALNDRSGLLASYLACKKRGILDFYTGSNILLENLIDRHHILPRAQFPEELRSASDTIANIAFISGDVNRAISQTGPEVYLKRVGSRVLESQCIPTEPALWSIERAEEFWAARCDLLSDAFNAFVKQALPNRRVARSR